MTASFLNDRADDMATLRDHLYRNGPCTVAEAARATGLRFGAVSSMLNDGSLASVGSTPSASKCSICRAPATVGDLCRRCREDLQSSQRVAEPQEERSLPDRGRGMRSRR